MSKIRCEAHRSVWVEVPEDDGEYACPECGGTISVEDEEAEHEDVEWVECPVNPGEYTLALLESEDGEDIACDHCEIENAITVSDGEATHDDIEWIECPFTDGDGTVVYLDDDDEVDCDHCNGSIYIEDGEAEHEDYADVECPLGRGKTTTVFLGDDREEECDHCGGTITIEDGEATHESWESCLDQLQEGEDGKDLIIVHGWLNHADKDYEDWRKQCAELGWSGNIWGYQWESGGILDNLGTGLLALGRSRVKDLRVIPVALLAQAAAWPISFRRARAAAEQEGETLASAIGQAIDQGRKVTVIGFSLGCRVVLFALRALGKAGYKNAVTVHLCGGAVEATESWKSQSIKKLTNYYSSGDWVLRAAFRVGTVGSSAIGSAGLDSSHVKKCRNVEALVDGEPIGHRDYEYCFAEFGKL